MNKIKSQLQRFAPSGKGFITGAVTAGVLYVAQHVLGVHLLSAQVEGELTPLIAFATASIAHHSGPVVKAVETEVTKVEDEGTKVIHTVDPTSTLTGKSLAEILGNEISARLDTPDVKDALVKYAAGLLHEAPAKLESQVTDVVDAIETDEPGAAHLASLASLITPPAIVAPTPPVEVALPASEAPEYKPLPSATPGTPTP
jgi:hypothetical protein